VVNIYFSALVLGTIVIWFSGKSLVQIVDFICEQTGVGRALMGTLLLGGITSLPEISTTLIAASLGNAELAASNLIGGVGMQTAMLAVADAFVLKQALTFIAPNSALLMGGVLLIIQTSYIITCITIGEIFHVFHIGLFAFGSFALYGICIYLLRNYENTERWVPTDYPNEKRRKKTISKQMRFIYLKLVLYSTLVFIGGSTVSYSAHKLTELTELNSSFLGATLVAFATSLPELSTTLTSFKIRAYTLGISNIFGSNILMLGLIFFADIFYRDGLLLNDAGSSAVFLAGLGILVTAIYLWGLLERRNRTILRMGIDSLLVIIVQILGLFTLYHWT
jgi:cation:H+ antiporter